ARAGGGPTLVEAVAYRLGPHGTADEPSLYRDPELDRLWQRFEPLARSAQALEAAGLASAAELEGIRSQQAEALRNVGERLEREPPASVEELAQGVHRQTPWTLAPGSLREPAWTVAEAPPPR
ncbi:MAG: thiamine pyrophosphate-dependent enzyme, partial [Candidatus Dormibacteria bacterium]